MTYRSGNSRNDQSTLARLASIRLNAHDHARARAEVLRAEAIADLLHRAWSASSTNARRFISAVRGRVITRANAYAQSAMRSSERKREAYIARATDLADLERRIRSWQGRATQS